MKTYLTIIITSFFALSIVSCQPGDSGNYQQANFKVWGNCEMCKETIEKSMKEIPGIKSADWDVKSKMMNVKYDSTVTVSAIHKKIASVGYDTELERGDDNVYKELHHCCQYKRKE